MRYTVGSDDYWVATRLMALCSVADGDELVTEEYVEAVKFFLDELRSRLKGCDHNTLESFFDHLQVTGKHIREYLREESMTGRQ